MLHFLPFGNMKAIVQVILVTIFWLHADLSQGQVFSKERFKNPPIHYWPRPLWFWNNTTVTADGITNQMQALRDKCGYGGFGILPFRKNFRPEYLSDEYFQVYGVALAKAKELGLTMSLYDEYGFPSGSAGAFTTGDGVPRFQIKYPEQTIKRLDKDEEEVSGPLSYEKRIPPGKLMGVVAMDATSFRRIDLTGKVSNGTLKWKAPSGKWRIMVFNCVKDGEPIVDYLRPDYVRNFIQMTHDAYYSRFKEYFGTVISGTFFDEPSMFHATFRMWTDLFNDKFKEKYGFSPARLYPALWYDIGPETESARNYLFGFRAELYAEGFTREANDWSVAHGITATGHTAPEEALVPVNAAGDLMKSFKHLEIPGVDKIGGNRPAERFYKLISSSAYNWDRVLVMSETYGAMPDFKKPGDLTWDEIYSLAMDQYAKGVNMLIPHAVWYDEGQVSYKPELSHRNPLYAERLPAFTKFLARLNVMLQPEGRHVADIAVLYPIHSLQGQHCFDTRKGPATIDGPPDPANDYYKTAVAQIDYADVANWLTEVVGKDFTFIHPEVLDEKCAVVGANLHLRNNVNPESFTVLIIPSCRTISVGNMQKIKDFYTKGGKVIFTTRLPSKSAEPNKDREVIKMVRSILPEAEKATKIVSNKRGGRACFIPRPNGQNLRDAILKLENSFDVDYPTNENIRYIHKVVDGRHLFYFANTGGARVETLVALRGSLRLEAWDPHAGTVQEMTTETLQAPGTGLRLTRVKLRLEPYRSCFWVEGSQTNN